MLCVKQLCLIFFFLFTYGLNSYFLRVVITSSSLYVISFQTLVIPMKSFSTRIVLDFKFCENY